MTGVPYTMAERRRMSQHEFGHRPTNDWGSGDLPSPWAAGDVVEVADGSVALQRMDGRPAGLYVVGTVFSIDEGDAWYVRLDDGDRSWTSGRLHIAFPDRSTWTNPIDWTEGVTLVDTGDPDGLADRRRMIDAGWGLVCSSSPCSRCGGDGINLDWTVMPIFVQQERSRGWRKPDGAVSVARPGRFGNPYTGPDAAGEFDAAIRRRAEGVRVRRLDGYPSDDEIRDALAGRMLMCWCPLDRPCHRSTLRRVANPVQPPP